MQGGSAPLLGDALVIVGTLCYALSNVGEKKMTEQDNPSEVSVCFLTSLYWGLFIGDRRVTRLGALGIGDRTPDDPRPIPETYNIDITDESHLEMLFDHSRLYDKEQNALDYEDLLEANEDENNSNEEAIVQNIECTTTTS